jgi:hypothetical protein
LSKNFRERNECLSDQTTGFLMTVPGSGNYQHKTDESLNAME